jgi:hypothetical protein
LTIKERKWLGSSIDLSTIRTVTCRPQWVVMPLRDTGIQLGKRAVDLIGTKASQRLALCMESSKASPIMRDSSIIQDIYEDIQDCLTVSRRRDLMRFIRANSLLQCGLHLRNSLGQGSLSIDKLIALLLDVVSHTLIGALICICIYIYVWMCMYIFLNVYRYICVYIIYIYM